MLLLSLANPPFRYEEETYWYTISQILSFRFSGEMKARACSTGTLSNNCDCLSMSREEIRGWLLEYTHTIYFIGCTYFNHRVFLFKSCLLCVTFCRLTPVSVPNSFPFHEGFWKRGLRDCLCWLLGHAQFSGPVPLKLRTIHLESWQAVLKALVNRFSCKEEKKEREAAHPSLQMIHLSLTQHLKYLNKN